MSQPLHVLLVEDDEDDAWLITRALQRHGMDPVWERVDSEAAMKDALTRKRWDIVLADYFVPGFGALESLEVLTERDLDIPLIVVSGVIGEETAVETMRAGARDYLLKNNLARLGPAIERELEEASVRRARRDVERLLRESAAQLRRVIESSPDVIVRVDRELCITLASPAVEQIAGNTAEDVVGQKLATLGYPPEHADRIERHSRRVLATGETAVIEHEVPTLSGSRWFETRLVPEHDDDGRCNHVLLTSSDITHRKGIERELTRRALQDPLTDLPNRLLFMDRLAHALARLGRDHSTVAVLFVDVDRFKSINDGYGHEAGDEVLLHVARRLLGAVRPADTVARMGGDEFVVLLEDAGADSEVLSVAARVAESITPPMAVDQVEISVTASVGIASTSVQTDPEALLRGADAAMYKAKQRGRNRCEFFDERLRAQAQARNDTERELRGALERSELRVLYQPEVDLTSGRVVGAEALLRWQHPERGMLEPADFLTVAEETGLIVPIGAWVIAEACRTAASWPIAVDEEPLEMWVNVSPRQLLEQELVDTVRRALADSGLLPSRFGVEVTESVLIDDVDAAGAALRALADLGVRICLDDFGTGYSPLTHLRRLPVEAIKIDQSFVDGVDTDPEDGTIVAAIIGLARSLGLRCVAEGVETIGQLAALDALGCDRAQGFFFARPLPEAEIPSLLGVAAVDPGRGAPGRLAI